MKKQIILFTTLLLALCSWLSFSQIPRTLSYQGVLTDSLGNPKPDGVQTFTFRLYDVESGGAALWTEIKDLQVKRGLFTTILGDITSFPPTVIFDKPYWLGIKPGAEPELSPRIPFSSVAYSLNSLKSDTAAYARVAPQAGYVDSARIAGSVQDNSITSAKILDGTVQSVDVVPTFTSPFADTAEYARNTPTIGFIDSARIAGTVQDNSITSIKIFDGTIQRTDVQSTFKSPYSDTSDYAKLAPPSGTAGGDLSGSYPNPTIASDAVTSAKILDGTIQRVDVAPTFTAPYSDTASYARVAPQAGYVDSARVAGTVPDNGITNSKLAYGSVTSTKIPAGQVIKSVNAMYDNITLSATGGATITSSGDTIIINAGSGGGGTGIQGVQNTNNTLDIIDPNGPTATINVKNSGITSTQIADAAVGTTKIADNTITSAKITDSSITSSKIVDGTIIGSDISTTAMLNITSLTTSGDVGVGTTNPTAPLHVTGNPSSAIVHFVNTAERVLINTVGNGAFPGLYINNNSVNVAGRDIRFQIGNQSMLTVANSGAVGIGTTDPTQKLDVAGMAQVAGFKMPTGAADGHVLTSNTSGVGTWQAAASGWNLTGNAGTIAGTNFVGTTDAQAFDIRTNNTLRTRITTKGQIETYNTGNSVFIGEGAGANDDLTTNQNVFVGYRAGFSNTTGYSNTANGRNALYSNTTGYSNTANGMSALYSNTTGISNTANGNAALYSNTTGSYNTANGLSALYSNTEGYGNTANGNAALFSNTTGYNNTANGRGALRNNTTGTSNTANGFEALYNNTIGYFNTANGNAALFSNTTGNNNTANGVNALYSNTTGYQNTASGASALYSNVSGSNGTAIGYNAMFYANNTITPFTNYNVAVGYEALRGSTTASANTGNGNTAIGYQTLWSNTSGYNNAANGYNALYSNTTGDDNTANGYNALRSNTTGGQNTANGRGTLYLNSIGTDNTANGYNALYFNSTGYSNTAHGRSALYANTTGYYNTANGWGALYSNVSGSQGTAIGYNAMRYANSSNIAFTNGNVAVGFEALRGSTTAANNTGNNNTSIGYQTLWSNTTGDQNTATGYNALYSNTTGYSNTANGVAALSSNTMGFFNTASGGNTLLSNTTGVSNTANGYSALYSNTTGNYNTANGRSALTSNTTGSYNTALGFSAGSTIATGSNLTLIGYNAEPTSASATNQITLGNSDVTSLRCAVTTITALSDARDKKNIQDLPLGLDFISKLKPRQFNWDKREWYENNISDGSKMQEAPTAGFIAQELDEVQTAQNTEWLNLVLKDNPEKIEATPGNLLPIMVKAIQELRAESVELRAENKELRTKNEELSSRLSELESVVNSLAQEKKTSDKQLIGELK
jgi:hypothetical protein